MFPVIPGALRRLTSSGPPDVARIWRRTYEETFCKANGLGYLLKERVADVREFVEAAERVVVGGSGWNCARP